MSLCHETKAVVQLISLLCDVQHETIANEFAVGVGSTTWTVTQIDTLWLKVDQNWIFFKTNYKRTYNQKRERKKEKCCLRWQRQHINSFYSFFSFRSVLLAMVRRRTSRIQHTTTQFASQWITKPLKWNVKLIVFVAQSCQRHHQQQQQQQRPTTTATWSDIEPSPTPIFISLLSNIECGWAATATAVATIHGKRID